MSTYPSLIVSCNVFLDFGVKLRKETRHALIYTHAQIMFPKKNKKNSEGQPPPLSSRRVHHSYISSLPVPYLLFSKTTPEGRSMRIGAEFVSAVIVDEGVAQLQAQVSWGVHRSEVDTVFIILSDLPQQDIEGYIRHRKRWRI